MVSSSAGPANMCNYQFAVGCQMLKPATLIFPFAEQRMVTFPLPLHKMHIERCQRTATNKCQQCQHLRSHCCEHFLIGGHNQGYRVPTNNQNQWNQMPTSSSSIRHRRRSIARTPVQRPDISEQLYIGSLRSLPIAVVRLATFSGNKCGTRNNIRCRNAVNCAQ